MKMNWIIIKFFFRFFLVSTTVMRFYSARKLFSIKNSSNSHNTDFKPRNGIADDCHKHRNYLINLTYREYVVFFSHSRLASSTSNSWNYIIVIMLFLCGDSLAHILSPFLTLIEWLNEWISWCLQWFST